MPFQYTQSNLQSGMNRGIQGKQGMLLDPQETMNEAVRLVLNEIRIRSTRRKALLVPNLLNGVFEYVCASDLHASAIIDIPAQAKRYDGEFTLVPSEQFAREPKAGEIAIDDFNGVRVLRIMSDTPDKSTSIDPLGVKGNTGDLWQAFGGVDGIATDSDQFIKGSSSVQFNIDATSATTAGLYKDTLDSLDLTDYLLKAAKIFSYARITSTTGITNFKLRIGTGASNYYEATVTTQNDGTAFANGQNLLAFDLSSLTTVGSPDVADITYVAIFMTKLTSKVSSSGYAFNWLTARKGQYADVKYYSKYGWQSVAGAYKENSTAVDDVLVADTDEFDLFVKKARDIAADETDLSESQIARIKKDFDIAKANYELKNPSEDKTVVNTYYSYD